MISSCVHFDKAESNLSSPMQQHIKPEITRQQISLLSALSLTLCAGLILHIDETEGPMC